MAETSSIILLPQRGLPSPEVFRNQLVQVTIVSAVAFEQPQPAHQKLVSLVSIRSYRSFGPVISASTDCTCTARRKGQIFGPRTLGWTDPTGQDARSGKKIVRHTVAHVRISTSSVFAILEQIWYVFVHVAPISDLLVPCKPIAVFVS